MSVAAEQIKSIKDMAALQIEVAALREENRRLRLICANESRLASEAHATMRELRAELRAIAAAHPELGLGPWPDGGTTETARAQAVLDRRLTWTALTADGRKPVELARPADHGEVHP